MDASTRVCPCCGERPGEGAFCVMCAAGDPGATSVPKRKSRAARPLDVEVAGPHELVVEAHRVQGEHAVERADRDGPPVSPARPDSCR